MRVHGAALRQYLLNRDMGDTGRVGHQEVESRLRNLLATMLGLETDEVALLSNASEAINLVIAAAELRPGDNVVLNELEYPSAVLALLRRRRDGVEVRVVPRKGWAMPTSGFEAMIDGSTRLIALSHVSYQTGWRHDIDAVSALADRVGAMLLLDATQSLGALPVPARLADATVASSYKWLLGGHGLGILGWNRNRRPLPEPAYVGWRSVPDVFTADRFQKYRLHDSARRFEVGYPSYPSIYMLDASIQWLNRFDASAVSYHIRVLSKAMSDALSEEGWEVLSASDDAHRSGNVAIACRRGSEVARHLRDRGIHCWGGDGRLRMSVHLFNGSDDVSRALDALARLPTGLRS